MLRDLILYPNPTLFEKSERVLIFDETLKQLGVDMLETMSSNNGIGLAAPQVGALKRVIVFKVTEPTVAINPVILEKNGKVTCNEGCLSVPGYNYDINRASEVKVEYQNTFGELIQRVFNGLEAVVFQHEVDHLDGIMFVDKLSAYKRQIFDKQFVKRQKLT